MKKSVIKNKYASCDITINSNEARNILNDLHQLETANIHTKQFITYLQELSEYDK